MSADQTLKVNINNVGSILGQYAAIWVQATREKPAVKVSRKEVLSILRQEPKATAAVTELEDRVQPDSQMWIEYAEVVPTMEGQNVHLHFRY